MNKKVSGSKNVTIKDVANKAGVAVSTASMALNNKPTISSDTKNTVLNVARDLGYHPTAAARALVDGKSSNVGLLIPVKVDSLFFSTGFFQKLIAGMNRAANEGGNMISLQIVESREETERVITEAYRTKNVSGSIITHPTQEMPYLDVINEVSYPVVFLGEPPRNFPYVDNDNYGVTKLATEHMIEHGHKRIAFLGGPKNLIASEARERGYRAALEQEGIEVQRRLIWRSRHDEQMAYQEVMNEAGKVEFSAICISVEEQMAGVYRALRDLGKSIPDDVALITIGDCQLAEHINPSMTTLDLHTEDLGYLAAKKLIRLINGEERQDSEIVSADLIRRQSCGCNTINGGDKSKLKVRNSSV
ncbi:LacI family DNA-binding transcriptional regulator [Candidatus Bipolaricaulota bacterium]|nr:LacI family DNA-binding transcriptional regulator [Candidatus Bipolaricaulota bacterium]MBS3825584.1 LacI family DNA-binding transcriptional regulator [Candidatus Bipolaricaulota bacterium]